MKTNRSSALQATSAAGFPKNALVSALALSCAAALSVTAAKPAHAYTPAYDTIGNTIHVSIIDRNSGRELPIYQYRGEYWVAGVPGAKYSVSVRNRIGERVLAVVSVDGVNVLSGETAGVNQQGYVFNRYQRYDVSGWRKSDHEVAAFTFVASPSSYAERTGRPDHVGTIGVALFREKQVPQWHAPTPRYGETEPRWRDPSNRFQKGEPGNEVNETFKSSEAPRALPAPAAPAPSAASGASSADSASSMKRGAATEGAVAQRRVEEKLGTGHGAREYDSVTRTTFERATRNPSEVIRIRYDSRENLIAMGVIPEPRRPWDRSPNPFPESFGHNGYVPDPPRWWR